jgi:8-oxo-dGTP pyrophosphatase MutT (NUDIX family)
LATSLRALIFAKSRIKKHAIFLGMMQSSLLSAGVVIVHSRSDGCRYLLLRCYHYWDFPKGLVEAGETPLAAACREVWEETSIENLVFSWGHDFIETARYGRGKIARYYLAASHDANVKLQVNPQLGHIEHHEYRWLEYDDARRHLNERLLPVIDWAHTLSGC